MTTNWCPQEVHVFHSLLICLTGLLLLEKAARGDVLVVANSTFACERVRRSSDLHALHKLELTDADMKQLFSQKGGEFIKSYMATSQQLASQHFLHLLDVFHYTPSFMSSLNVMENLKVSQVMRKMDIKQLLRTEEATEEHTECADNKNNNNNNNNNDNNKNRNDNLLSSTSTLSPTSDVYQESLVSDSDVGAMETDLTKHSSVFAGDTKDHAQGVDRPSTRNSDSTLHPNDDSVVESPFLKRLRHLTQSGDDYDGNIRETPSKRETTPPSIVRSALPYVLPDSIGMETTMDSNQGYSNIEYCLERGEKERDHYLRLCTACAVTTNLGDNYWPSILNEVLCSDTDPYCMIIQGVENGRCQQRVMPMNLLRKKEGYCSLAMKDGQVVIVDEWEIYPREINIGCECAISKNSMLAEFV